MSPLTNAERQARYKQRLRNAAYENDLLKKQIAELEAWVQELQAATGLPVRQLPKSAYDPHR